MAAPTTGATQKSQSCSRDQLELNTAEAVARAGLNGALPTDRPSCSRTAKARPTAMAAAVLLMLFRAVVPRNTATRMAAPSTSSRRTAARGAWMIECSPKPAVTVSNAVRLSWMPGSVRRIPKSAKAPRSPPTSCAPMYAAASTSRIRPATACPTVTAGLKCPPETYPKASIAAVTARPAASAAGSGLDCGMVNSGTPRPATTMKRVPKASADSLDTSPCRTSALLPAVSPEAGSRWTGTGVVMVGQSLSLGCGAFAFCQGILGVG